MLRIGRAEIDPARRQVYVDRDLWEKIVRDLLSNAFKFIFDGSIRLETRYQNHLVARQHIT